MLALEKVHAETKPSLAIMRSGRPFLATTIGQTALMATTGAFLYVYVLCHLLGNLQIYLGREQINAHSSQAEVVAPSESFGCVTPKQRTCVVRGDPDVRFSKTSTDCWRCALPRWQVESENQRKDCGQKERPATPNVLIPMQRGEMLAYLATPPATGRVPGVVVIHDAGGMTQDSRNQADWLAEAGFLALALNLYHRGGLAFCIRTIIHDLIMRSGPNFTEIACADIESARAWLSLQPGCNGRAGIIGFCMGGAFAFAARIRPRLLRL